MASLLCLVCFGARQSSESHLEGYVESLRWPRVLPPKGWPWWSGYENTGSCGQMNWFPGFSSSAAEFCSVFAPPALQCRILFCLHPQLWRAEFCSVCTSSSPVHSEDIPLVNRGVFWSEWEPVWLSLWNYWDTQTLLIDRHEILRVSAGVCALGTERNYHRLYLQFAFCP